MARPRAFDEQEVLNPQGWDLLNFLMDARTGLGRFHEFRISNYQLMMALIDYCAQHSIEQIMELPDVRERMLPQAAEPIGNTPQEYAQFIAGEIAKWAKVVKASGATPTLVALAWAGNREVFDRFHPRATANPAPAPAP